MRGGETEGGEVPNHGAPRWLHVGRPFFFPLTGECGGRGAGGWLSVPRPTRVLVGPVPPPRAGGLWRGVALASPTSDLRGVRTPT